MDKPYTIYGFEMSPYSLKVRSWFRYKNNPNIWVPSGAASNDPNYKRQPRLAIVPTAVLPHEETALQDSTPIIERLEAKYPSPMIDPKSTALSFLSPMIEEFGDEWGNKLKFHLRWYAKVDMSASSLRAARLALPDGSDEDVTKRAAMVRGCMLGRGHFVCSSDQTAPLVTAYFVVSLDILQRHHETRKYLFGARPALSEIGLAARIYHA
jgi:hypothetical protein